MFEQPIPTMRNVTSTLFFPLSSEPNYPTSRRLRQRNALAGFRQKKNIPLSSSSSLRNSTRKIAQENTKHFPPDFSAACLFLPSRRYINQTDSVDEDGRQVPTERRWVPAALRIRLKTESGRTRLAFIHLKTHTALSRRKGGNRILEILPY